MVLVGDLVTYTLTATNLHPLAAMHDLVLTDTLPVSTTFVTTTLPYTIANGTIIWELPELEAQEVWTVTLVVRAPEVANVTVVNEHYGLVSTEVSTPVVGDPVTTRVVLAFWKIYLPLVMKIAP